MGGPAYLKVTLKLMALYAGVMAALTLFFHDAGEFLFGYTIKDPVTTMYWGGVLFAMAIFYLFLSMDPEKYKLFIWIGLFDLGVATLITIYHIAHNNISWMQGISAAILNPIFIIVILTGITTKKEGEVVLISGGENAGRPEQELPSHIIGEHPLHRK